MEISGKIIVACEPRGGVSARTGNSWKTQEFVVETIEQYPRKCCFEVFGEDKLREFNIQAGDVVKVFFDVNASEYKGRWYNSIRAWKVEHIGGTVAATPQVTPQAPQVTPQAPQKAEDDLPF